MDHQGIDTIIGGANLGRMIGLDVIAVVLIGFGWVATKVRKWTRDDYYSSSYLPPTMPVEPVEPPKPIEPPTSHPTPSSLWKALDLLDKRIASVKPLSLAKLKLAAYRKSILDLYERDPDDRQQTAASVRASLATVNKLAEAYIAIQIDSRKQSGKDRSTFFANLQVHQDAITALNKRVARSASAAIAAYDEINHGNELKELRELK